MDKKLKKFVNIVCVISDVMVIMSVIVMAMIIALPIVFKYQAKKMNLNFDDAIIDLSDESNSDYRDLNNIGHKYDIDIISRDGHFDENALITIFVGKSLGAILTTATLVLISNIFKNIRRKDSIFIKENEKKVKVFSILIAIQVVVPNLIVYGLSKLLGVYSTNSIIISEVFYAFITIVLAKVYEYGCVLQQESDETL